MSDRLEDILNRVLRSSADQMVSGVGRAAVPRRTLRDPETNSVGFFQDVSAAVRNIRSPEIVSALRSHGMSGGAGGNAQTPDFGNMGENGQDPDSLTSPADSRRTTGRDDARVMVDLAGATSAMVKTVTTAGRAIGEFTGNTKKLDKAVTESAEGVEKANRKTWVDAVGLGGLMKRLTGGGNTGNGSASESPSSPAVHSRKQNLNEWLNSSSLADGVLNLVARITVSAGTTRTAPGDPNQKTGTIRERLNDRIDELTSRSLQVFSRMRRTGGNMFSRGFGRAGSRAILSNVRERAQRGRNLIRGRARVMPASGGGVPGWPRGVASLANGSGTAGASGDGGGGLFARIAGMFGGGGAAAGGGGSAGAGGGAAGSGAAAGGMGGALLIGFAAVAAVALVVASSLTKLGIQGYETALRLEKFDGALSGAKAQLEVGQLLRDIQTARELSKSGATLIGNVNKLEDTLRPVTDMLMVAGTDFLNTVMPKVQSGVQMFVGAIAGAARGLDMFAEMLGWDAIDNKLLDRLDKAAAGKAGNNQVGLPQAAFHNMFLNLPPAAPPRPPLPPLGGP